MHAVEAINDQIVHCGRCPRLVAWREAAAAAPPARFRDQTYWARPVPGFGDPLARLLVVGLAPAANGGNRTGRIFTGDPSGDWLCRALHRAGFASQPTSRDRSDGLRLTDCYLSAVVRCAPPDNKPLPDERDHCLPYLVTELRALERVRVIVALGAFAWDGTLRALRALGYRRAPAEPLDRAGHSGRANEAPARPLDRAGHRGRANEAGPKPVFGHGAVTEVGPYRLVGSYHPSQRNTSTRLLSEAALGDVFALARRLLARTNRKDP